MQWMSFIVLCLAALLTFFSTPSKSIALSLTMNDFKRFIE